MFIYYRPRGSNFGIGAGLGTAGFIGFLILLGFIPFYVIYLALRLVIWALSITIYLIIMIVAYFYKRGHGYPPAWKLHSYPDPMDEWLDQHNIVKIPGRTRANHPD